LGRDILAAWPGRSALGSTVVAWLLAARAQRPDVLRRIGAQYCTVFGDHGA
jgi:hypothetical protein